MVKQLTVDTSAVEAEAEHQLQTPKDKYSNHLDTPRTESSTPNSSYAPVRGQSDIRSPGMDKTPSNINDKTDVDTQQQEQEDDENVPIPDFMTQTDKYGNASTPRTQPSPTAIIVQKSTDSDSTQEVEVDDLDKDYHPPDACDTLLESLRMMCCCLLPDPNSSNHDKLVSSDHTTSKDVTTSNSTIDISKCQIMKQRRFGSSEPVYGHIDHNSVFHEMERITLLPGIVPQDYGRKCLVLDLDETLVHSSFRAVSGADFIIPVQIDDVVHYVYVIKRPGVDEFLVEMAKHYEIILYTASLNKYANPLLDLLDPHRTIRTRLFRESCVFYEGNYVKDLSLLDRDLSQTIIVDNSPASYIFHPENAIDCSSFIDDPSDVELDQMSAFFKGVKDVEDVRNVCSYWKEWPHMPIVDESLNGLVTGGHHHRGPFANVVDRYESMDVQ